MIFFFQAQKNNFYFNYYVGIFNPVYKMFNILKI